MPRYFINVAFAVTLLVSIAAIWRLYNVNEDFQKNHERVEAMSGILDTARNRHNELVAEKSVLTAKVRDAKAAIDSYKEAVKDSSKALALLRREIDRKTRQLAAFDASTNIDSVIIEPENDIDEAHKDSCPCQVWPTYFGAFSDEWASVRVKANRDSIVPSISVRNRFAVEFEEQNAGIFKPRKVRVRVTSQNPYTYTDDVRAFSVPRRKGKWILPFCIGIGVGAGAMVGISAAVNR